MARIPGIQIEKDSKGRPTYARINLKKRKDALPYLKQVGAIEEDQVINPDDYISSGEFWKEVQSHVEDKNDEYEKKCKEATPFLEQLGAFSDDDFEKEWAAGLTLEEAKKEMRDFIDKWDWKPEQRKYFLKTSNPT